MKLIGTFIHSGLYLGEHAPRCVRLLLGCCFFLKGHLTGHPKLVYWSFQILSCFYGIFMQQGPGVMKNMCGEINFKMFFFFKFF